jgi:hypothetical protein
MPSVFGIRCIRGGRFPKAGEAVVWVVLRSISTLIAQLGAHRVQVVHAEFDHPDIVEIA